MLADLLEFLGTLAGGTASQACFFLFVDEPECPKSLIK